MHARLLAAALAALAGAVPVEARTTVTIACGSVGIEAELCREGAEAWAQSVTGPSQPTQALAPAGGGPFAPVAPGPASATSRRH